MPSTPAQTPANKRKPLFLLPDLHKPGASAHPRGAMMKRWRAPAASRARYGCDAPARLARGEIASTRADRSRVTKTIAGINRRRHQDQHYNECTKQKQAGFHLPSPSLLRLQPDLDQAAEGLGSRNVASDCPGIKHRYGCWFEACTDRAKSARMKTAHSSG